MYTPELKAKIEAQRRQLEYEHSPGYEGGSDVTPLCVDVVLAGLMIWTGMAGMFIIPANPLWGVVGVLCLLAFGLQHYHRFKTRRRNYPMLCGPFTLLTWPLVKNHLERRFNKAVKQASAEYGSEEQTAKELHELCISAKTAPAEMKEQKQLLVWLLCSDQEIRATTRQVERAINDTNIAISRLEPFCNTLGVTDLVAKLCSQKAALEQRKNELNDTREQLEQELTGTKEKFEQLNKARLALDSLKLVESNSILLSTSEEVMTGAKALCERWDSRVGSLELDTKALIYSIPEAKEVYSGVTG